MKIPYISPILAGPVHTNTVNILIRLLGWLTHTLTLPTRGHPSHAEACWKALRTSAKSFKTAQKCPKSPKIARKRRLKSPRNCLESQSCCVPRKLGATRTHISILAGLGLCPSSNIFPILAGSHGNTPIQYFLLAEKRNHLYGDP
jgi:hypothetical protein